MHTLLHMKIIHIVQAWTLSSAIIIYTLVDSDCHSLHIIEICRLGTNTNEVQIQLCSVLQCNKNIAMTNAWLQILNTEMFQARHLQLHQQKDNRMKTIEGQQQNWCLLLCNNSVKIQIDDLLNWSIPNRTIKRTGS